MAQAVCNHKNDGVERRSSFLANLAGALAAGDHFITWWGAHRQWPATDPIRIEDEPETMR
ncbi:hypothetical protein CLG96_02360 [Sphingomonas oleivorans]|uniref:Uncharacterized protein n=1 Tax=Sphingomonas oleivorans TaxID=1735121 RepID=A0A2T5G1J1_9SPHN|nr:hypothetical protein [Sphingomonas oleivorans]PTQ13008.1 hypothetical protein CLG96_02360 [Sphingomonas oleivorans]